MAGSFVAWVTAEPAWLAVGHSHPGTVTIDNWNGRNCVGRFDAADGSFAASSVDIAGLTAGGCRPGASREARVTSAEPRWAYVLGVRGLAFRATIGYGLLLLCGLAIAWVTGAFRLVGWRRGVGILVSLAVPAILATVALIAAY